MNIQNHQESKWAERWSSCSEN